MATRHRMQRAGKEPTLLDQAFPEGTLDFAAILPKKKETEEGF